MPEFAFKMPAVAEVHILIEKLGLLEQLGNSIQRNLGYTSRIQCWVKE